MINGDDDNDRHGSNQDVELGEDGDDNDDDGDNMAMMMIMVKV